MIDELLSSDSDTDVKGDAELLRLPPKKITLRIGPPNQNKPGTASSESHGDVSVGLDDDQSVVSE
jgi:hypothetical protein